MSEDRADTANLLKAIEFASRKHSTQRRKDKEASPYINHPIAVAHLLADTGGVTDPVTLMAAVLHDTIEDTETTAEELEAQFGPAVREVVEEVTDNKSLEKAVRKQRQIDHAPNLSKQAKTIKLADKIANVQDVTDAPPAHWDLARRIDYLEWTESVVAGCRGTNAPLRSSTTTCSSGDGRSSGGNPFVVATTTGLGSLTRLRDTRRRLLNPVEIRRLRAARLPRRSWRVSTLWTRPTRGRRRKGADIESLIQFDMVLH